MDSICYYVAQGMQIINPFHPIIMQPSVLPLRMGANQMHPVLSPVFFVFFRSIDGTVIPTCVQFIKCYTTVTATS